MNRAAARRPCFPAARRTLGEPSAFALIVLLVVGVLSGCASTLAQHNSPLETGIAAAGYRIGAHERSGVPESLAFGLSFSGGGTRAAALAYGVLEELARTTVVVGGQQRRMLDLVETISAVSGGSYTAAYYGLFGDRLFEDFEARFLKKDIESEIKAAVFSPVNLFRMTSPYFGRSDAVAEYFDQSLFDGLTFSDLDRATRRGQRPFVLINATDMARTSRFEFTQDQFDLLCSDLSRYQVARAVAASSAVPVIFSPITLANYADRCSFREPEWMTSALRDRHVSVRRYAVAADQRSYLDAEKRRFVHLLDGGLSDNLGLRAVLDRLAIADAANLADAYRRTNLRRLVQVVVNAQARQELPELDGRAEVPTLSAIAFAVSNATDRHSVETLAHARNSLRDAARSLAAQRGERGLPDPGDVQALLIEISFDDLTDPAEREYFNSLPTSFSLPPEAVDRLREVGARLLRSSADFQRLVRELPTLQ